MEWDHETQLCFRNNCNCGFLFLIGQLNLVNELYWGENKELGKVG